MVTIRSGGRLVIVGTPIGNLGDMSPRAIDALNTADAIACEDTRQTRKLATLLNISPRELFRFDHHTETQNVDDVLNRIEAGEVIALVSDAGMPGVSDPGQYLIRSAHDRDVTVEVIPGPVAAITAYVGSGLGDDSGRFCFEGFLPKKDSERKQRLADLQREVRVMVFYEAPHRLLGTLAEFVDVFGPDREVAVARELTKLYEEIWTGTLEASITKFTNDTIRGEFVLVLDGFGGEEVNEDQIVAALRQHLEDGESKKDAAANVADLYGLPHNQVKRLVLGL